MAKARASDASRRVCLLGIKIHGGIGIMMDDVIAAVYANVVMQLGVLFV